MRRYTVKGLTAELTSWIRARYPMIEVEGELTQVATPRSGHAYLTLAEGTAVLGAVCWRDTWRNQRFRPVLGDRVVCRGRLSVYDAKGAWQLYVNTIEPAGAGKLAAEIAKRKARLEAEGLLDPRRKRPLPAFPRTVGVATSLTGAALQDFLEVTRERCPATRILIADCRVQGAHSAGSVVQAVELLIRDGRSEVIVVTRGGGSAEDLAAFQDEGLARFIALSPVPTVSAVGHQVDTSLCDLVADVVAPTPSAAAAAVTPESEQLMQRVDELEQALSAGLARRLAAARDRTMGLRARLRSPAERLATIRRRAHDLEARLAAHVLGRLPSARRAVEGLEVRLPVAALRRLQGARQRVQHAEDQAVACTTRTVGVARARVDTRVASLTALSPQAVLERGYAVVMSREGVVQDPSQVGAGDPLVVRVAKGQFGARVDPSVE